MKRLFKNYKNKPPIKLDANWFQPVIHLIIGYDKDYLGVSANYCSISIHIECMSTPNTIQYNQTNATEFTNSY